MKIRSRGKILANSVVMIKMKKIARYLPVFLFWFFLISHTPLFATQVRAVEILCPICFHQNQFYTYASIHALNQKCQSYGLPQAFRDNMMLWTCTNCFYSSLCMDFSNVSADDQKKIKSCLSKIDKKNFNPDNFPKPAHSILKYMQIPIKLRLSLAEDVYNSLSGRFYQKAYFFRVMALWLDYEDKTADQLIIALKKSRACLLTLLKEDPQAASLQEVYDTLFLIDSKLGDLPSGQEFYSKIGSNSYFLPRHIANSILFNFQYGFSFQISNLLSSILGFFPLLPFPPSTIIQIMNFPEICIPMPDFLKRFESLYRDTSENNSIFLR